MINTKNVSFVLLLSVLSGCDFNVTDIQSIDINHYSENEKNVKLARDLMYYDPRYIASKVPAFDEKTSQGIRLGYFVKSSDGKPSYRVTYSLKNPNVASNIDTLKKQFEEFIPKLAAFHASKQPLFIELEPKGKAWVLSLFTDSARKIYSESSSVLKENVSQEKFIPLLEKISEEYGKPEAIEFVRAQYYESFEQIPESISLYYKTSFKSDKTLSTRVSLVQEQNKWLVIGFNLEQI